MDASRMARICAKIAVNKMSALDGLDGRSQTARRFRDLVEGMGNDLGGSDRLSEGQRQLIRRAATLSIMSESVEADFIRNLAFDSEAYGVLCDRLGRCLQGLGLEPRPIGSRRRYCTGTARAFFRRRFWKAMF